MKYTTATVRFFLLLGLFCSWTLPARTQPGEKETLERRLAAAKDASPDALLNTVQELAAGLTEQVGRQLKEALKDEGFFDQGEEYRFVAAALALTRKQDPGLRKLGLTSALVLARKAASKEIRSLSIRLLGESGELGRAKAPWLTSWRRLSRRTSPGSSSRPAWLSTAWTTPAHAFPCCAWFTTPPGASRFARRRRSRSPA